MNERRINVLRRLKAPDPHGIAKVRKRRGRLSTCGPAAQRETGKNEANVNVQARYARPPGAPPYLAGFDRDWADKPKASGTTSNRLAEWCDELGAFQRAREGGSGSAGRGHMPVDR